MGQSGSLPEASPLTRGGGRTTQGEMPKGFPESSAESNHPPVTGREAQSQTNQSQERGGGREAPTFQADCKQKLWSGTETIQASSGPDCRAHEPSIPTATEGQVWRVEGKARKQEADSEHMVTQNADKQT